MVASLKEKSRRKILLAAMQGRPADLAEATTSRFASSPFFLWRAAS
ncbi:hypothetical protein QYR02_05490 [Microbacterium maritypicum]|nr:hypothetical protein [Microbacterium liquefaciens]WKT90381.1 hypothetical protein QYR02_05490 [Microbacterium liquefaciens]